MSRAAPAVSRRPRWLIPLIGLAVFVGVALVVVWFLNQRRPPALQLMPIERPSIPINLDSQSQLASLGQWEVDAFCQQLAFSPDVDRLASACNREKARFSPYRYYASLYQVRSGVLEAHLLDHTAWMKSLDFAPDSASLATSADRQRVDLWQVSDGALLRTIESGQGPVGGLDFSVPSLPS